MVLVDTSVWIEFFSKKKNFAQLHLSELLEKKEVASCLPVKTEMLSGQMTNSTRTIIDKAFNAIPMLDLDWNDRKIWGEMVAMAELAYKKQLNPPGIVDRMICLCAKEANIPLWTFDKKLMRLASLLQISYHPQ